MSAKSPRTQRKSNPRKEVESEDEELNDVGEEDGGYYVGDVYIPPPPPPPKYSGDATGTRLIITHIENINFKSYAGRQVIGPFHKSFTSIVGPNGSGKSNVIDSMLFVFGYRAQKLRSKKLNVLIHNSDTHPNCQMAQVIVHFALIDDKVGEDFETIAGSEFTVSRSVTKQNVLAYYINGKKVQYKEVALLLQSHGIDLRYNRFLILQGEVEQISLMKPKGDENDPGMLEFLEDIIGSSRLKAPLALLLEKVEETNIVRSEKMNRLKVVKKEKEVLQEARNEAVRFLKGENDLSFKQNQLYQIHKVEAVEVRDESQKEYERAKKVYEDVISEIGEITKARVVKEKEAQDLQKRHADISKAAEETNEAFKELERKDVQVRNKIKHNKAKGKKLIEDLEKEKKRLNELKLIPDRCKEEVTSLEEKKARIEQEKTAADAKLAEAMSEIEQVTRPLQIEKEKYETQLLSLQKGVNEAKSKLEVAQSELDIYLNKEKTEKSKLEQLKWRSDNLQKDFDEKRASLTALEKQLPTTEAEMNQIKTELTRLDQARNEISHDLGRAIESYEEARNLATATSSRNAVLNALMEQKRLGNIKGLLGRLGDLGAIEKKYDVAISTACGALDNLVTETMDDAKTCVKYLKANNIGAATFIGLDQMTKWETACNTRITTPENVPRLFDLVRVKDQRVKTAFYHALRDTLVADNLTQATRIGLKGYKRWRVVTLKGELVEVSGAMSGGGRPSSGRMGTSVTAADFSDEELRQMENKVSALRNKLEEVKSRFNELNVRNEQLTSEYKIMQQNLPKFKLEVGELQRQQQVLRNSIEQQQKAVSECLPDAKIVKSMETKVKKLEQEYEKASVVSKKIEHEIVQLNAKIADIMDKTVGTPRKLVESLEVEMKQLSIAITKAGVAEKTALRNIEKSEQKLVSLEKDIEETEVLIAKLKDEIKRIEEDAQEVTTRYDTQTSERDEMAKAVKVVVDEINKMKQREMSLNSDNVDAKHEAESMEKVFKQKDAEVKHWDDKIKALTLHEIDGEDPPEPLPVYDKDDISEYDAQFVQREIDNLEKELKKMKPNIAAIAEYREKELLYLERFKEFEEVTQKRDMFKAQHEQIRSQRLKEFKDGFLVITRKLKEMYRMITMGGDAELEWIDSLDPFSEGINFAVRPNKKSWKRISNLSGGEKTLSSLSLIFALHYFKPSPLYVMDEIDAALDFKNVSIVAHYIKQRTNNTQFIIISLRNDMYELANRLVGIYKTFNCTKSVTINPAIIEAQRNRIVDGGCRN